VASSLRLTNYEVAKLTMKSLPPVGVFFSFFPCVRYSVGPFSAPLLEPSLSRVIRSQGVVLKSMSSKEQLYEELAPPICVMLSLYSQLFDLTPNILAKKSAKDQTLLRCFGLPMFNFIYV